MSALQGDSSQNNVTDELLSHPFQPAQQSILPPFSGTLRKDGKLKLSKENFKESIDNFLEDEDINSIDQLTTTPAFPTPYVLAQFASKAYEDYKRRETDADYEKRLILPDGWKLLTTASNTKMNNGYFGAAYWQPEHQQVVIAHRGTKLNSFGALWTDIKGVLFKHYVKQMDSATTFAYKVVEVLQEVNREKGVHFQVFFTGHSLGGWLAQVTTYSTEYLKIGKDNNFLKNDNVPQSYHPHTVVFDSPGCKAMLSDMIDTFDLRQNGGDSVLQNLDITSYLSAPNRINTCNTHVGTVYRIFIDTSHMGWWAKHTALYNAATHSMNKILNIFDSETGQVQKDEKDRLRIREVIDWPVSGRLLRRREYKHFFKWAKKFNDYQPEITDEYPRARGYHPIRYQTKVYEEQVNNLRIFNQEEKEFLQGFRMLSNLPEFFKPKEVFSVMQNDKAEEEAEKKIQSFQIENGNVRYADASILQAPISYVRRLLQLFPKIKENVKYASSPHEVRNRVYQFETKTYLEEVKKSLLDFNPDILGLKEFLESDQQVLHLQMVDGDAWTGLIKVYRIIEKTTGNGSFPREGQYAIMSSDRFLTVNKMMDFNTFMTSTETLYLLMISWESNHLCNDEKEQVFRKLFNTVQEKPLIKIILTTQSKGESVDFLQKIATTAPTNMFVSRDEKLTWTDLTTESQKKLLGKTVEFQGRDIALNELIAVDSPVACYLPISGLLGEHPIKIAEELISNSTTYGYNDKWYVDRTFNHQVAIKHEILHDDVKENFPDFLTNNEQEFKRLCQQNPERNVHLLVKDNSGKLVWQASQGSFETLRKYIDTQTSDTYTPMELLEQAQHQRVMVISDTAGMGKSTVLTHLSRQIKEKFPNIWVIRIDLNHRTDELGTLKKGTIDKEKATEFVSKELLKLKNEFDLKLFEYCSEKRQIRIVLMLDGFDEISPYYEKIVIDLLQTLKIMSVLEFWITTRPHLRQKLEDNLQQLSYTLEPFCKEKQVEFLKKFWLLRDWFTEVGNEQKGKDKNKLETYAKELIEKLSGSISDRDKEFTGIPLQCRMLAEAFDGKVKTFFQSSDPMPDLSFKLDLLELYALFVNSKYDIYVGDKCRTPLTNVIAIEQREKLVKEAEDFHQGLAIQMLFPGEKETLKINDNSMFSDEKVIEMSRIGIFQVNYEHKLHFIHRTFAEYNVANFVVNQMIKEPSPSPQVQDFVLKDVLLKEEYLVIRVFVDGLLSKSEPSTISKQYGNRIDELRTDDVLIQEGETTILHRAAYEGNAHIIGFLLHILKKGKHTETLNKLLLAKNIDGRTAWHLAAKGGNTKVWQNLWDWAVETFTLQEINNELLLAKDDFEETVWHRATKGGNTQLLEKILGWAKDTLTREELNNRLLLDKEVGGRTAWHVAAGLGNTQVLEKLWEWSKEELTTDELNNELLLAKDSKGQTAWHYAAQTGNKEMLEQIWRWANEAKGNIKKNLLLSADNYGYTAWLLATEWGKEEVCEKIWKWAEKELTTEEIKNNFVLAQCDMDPTSWHLAAKRGNTNQLHKLWEWCKQELPREELNSALLLRQNGWGRTALHLAAEAGHTEVIVKVCEWVKGAKLNLRDNLLLVRDNYGYTAWHLAALCDNAKAWEKLWDLAKEELTTVEINNKLLLAKNRQKHTVFHLAARGGNTDALEKLWVWAKEKLTTEELHHKLLLAKDLQEQTVWHRAAEGGHTNVLQKLCEWVKDEKLHLENNPLLTQDKDGETALHLAALAKRSEVWEWAKKELTTEELKNTFILPKSSMQVTACHVAADMGNTDDLDKLWEWAHEKLKREKVTRSMLYKGFQGHNVWHNAVIAGNTNILEKTWEWFKEELTREELHKKLFADKDNEGKNIMHLASQGGRTEIIEKVWKWATEVIPNVGNKLLLDQDMDGHTPWHLAAKSGKAEVWEKLWHWAKEGLTREELNYKLLLAKNSMQQTALHLVAEDGNADALEKLWAWAKGNLSQEELNNELLLVKDFQGQTALHRAAEGGHTKVLEKLCEWAKEEKLNLKDNLLLVQDKEGKSAFDILKQHIRVKESNELTTSEILKQYLSKDEA
jgi:ankyrin repeat protein